MSALTARPTLGRPATLAVSASLLLSSALLVVLDSTPSTGSPTSSDASLVTSALRKPKQKATISVLPPISQPGATAASTKAARTVVSATFSPRTTKRPAVLQQKAGGGWRTVGKTRLTKQGLAEFSVKTSKKATYRVTAAAFKGLAPVSIKAASTKAWGNPDFADEFSGSAAGAAWSHRVPDYNPAGLRRCAKGSPAATAVSGGALRLSVIPDPARSDLCTALSADGRDLGQYRYRLNGHVSTEQAFSFTYGVAAARMKFPKDAGQHASFWLKPAVEHYGSTSPTVGGAEIDVIEWFGVNPKSSGLASFLYYPTAKGIQKTGGFVKSASTFLAKKSDTWWSAYHVFSVEWTPKAYIFRIDGRETMRFTEGISTVPQFPILSLLSSDYELSSLGDETKLPQHLDVDWVQVWDS